ncbi:FAD-binding domain-containing protein, partial [Vibrio vulnificus]|uniref:FAD-binding domain-containing protein n=1 Tax=Vibrio vulnificus TaxID=672 RepID=UPI0039B65833
MRNFAELSPEENQKALAWIEGRTGFPMVDACMRMLRTTGWVNFRMRAMLVAFASYQLWLDWRHTAPMLAREFLDYEPG